MDGTFFWFEKVWGESVEMKSNKTQSPPLKHPLAEKQKDRWVTGGKAELHCMAFTSSTGQESANLHALYWQARPDAICSYEMSYTRLQTCSKRSKSFCAMQCDATWHVIKHFTYHLLLLLLLYRYFVTLIIHLLTILQKQL